MNGARIKLCNVNKSYYSDNSVTQALRGISLSFCTGEFVAITGESGSGKSTLLNILAGLENIDDGEMYIDDESTQKYDDEDWESYRRDKISYVFQDYGIIGHYSAIDNIVCVLVSLGMPFLQARVRAAEYLKKVGLSGFEKKKASQLSSGQKQRLSIARALSKNTGIILLDEPTGNLDSETGEQIIMLLKNLSKECLIIMVTHNYSQVEPYATRKIRIHDGVVVSDEKNSGTDYADATVSNIEKQSIKSMKLSWYYALLNIRTQKGRAVMMFLFIFIMSALFFVLIGIIRTREDDIFTKQYQKKAFYKEDDTRIVIRKSDGSDITLSDIEAIKALRYVETADICDISNDINFYLEEGTDYEYIYGWQFRQGSNVTVNFLNDNRFVMSDCAIDESDLKYGTLPAERNDIVIYSNSQKSVGKTVTVLFRAKNIWNNTEYYKAEFNICGVLKEPSEQVYFSKEFCMMLASAIDAGELRLCSEYDLVMQDYKKKTLLMPMIDDSLHGDEAYLSTKAEVKSIGNTPFVFIKDGITTELSERVLTMTHDSSKDFIFVSEEVFYRYYEPHYTQASVYISHYAKTDAVMDKLNKMGYECVSTIRIGAGDYVDSRVNERIITILICAAVLILSAAAKILILFAMQKIRVKDSVVMKNIGMKLKVVKLISCFEILTYELFAVMAVVLVMNILKNFGISIVDEIMWYISFGSVAAYIALALLSGGASVLIYNNLLKRRLS